MSGIGSITNLAGITGIDTSSLYSDGFKEKVSNNNASFEALFKSAVDMYKDANNASNAAEEAEINYVRGYLDNEHDLSIAQQKASSSLSYTVQVTKKVLEAYKEIMNIQV